MIALQEPARDVPLTIPDASGDVMVEIFRDRITVSNPGGLVSWLRREDFGKYSRTRNRLIASLLMRTPYVEKMGTGILRINVVKGR